ncbi:hypothetical protein [Bizionia sp.]|uniref:hypothetical protein n=1 Tax=Bizionia sp. TaxID=1954480 RepID=UPI003A9489B0
MTNLNKIFKLYDVQSHNQRTVKELLTVHLPKTYTSEVIEYLNALGVSASSQTVRNVKSGTHKDLIIFNAIITLAEKYQQLAKDLENKLQTAV